jgi:hypothetical protein
MLGWLGNAFLAFLYHGVPLLTGARVTSARLGWWLFGVWNLAVLAPGWVLVRIGILNDASAPAARTCNVNSVKAASGSRR